MSRADELYCCENNDPALTAGGQGVASVHQEGTKIRLVAWQVILLLELTFPFRFIYLFVLKQTDCFE